MEKKRFQRKIEDFVCEHCGTVVRGDGYTDHCPNCLWGKHVDNNPGDRAANCGGALEPVAVSIKNQAYRIEYRCQKCGHRYVVKSGEKDNMEEIIKLSTNQKS